MFILPYWLADHAHRFVAALVYRRFAYREEARLWEKCGSLEGKIAVPRWLDRPAWACYLAKIVFLTLGFLALIAHVGLTTLGR